MNGQLTENQCSKEIASLKSNIVNLAKRVDELMAENEDLRDEIDRLRKGQEI